VIECASSIKKAAVKRLFMGKLKRISCACRGNRCRSRCWALSAWRCSPRWSGRWPTCRWVRWWRLGLLRRWTFRQRRNLWSDQCHGPSWLWPTWRRQTRKSFDASWRRRWCRASCPRKFCCSWLSLSERWRGSFKTKPTCREKRLLDRSRRETCKALRFQHMGSGRGLFCSQSRIV